MKTAFADPPKPIKEEPAPEKPSYVAYLSRGDDHHEIGIAMTTGDSHRLPCHIGPRKGEVIELRAIDPEFNPGAMKRARGEKNTEPKPSFAAFLPGTEDRIGTAFPHQDGKGHRLKFRLDIADGTVIELRTTGHYYGAGEQPKQKPGRSRKPRIAAFQD